jgi:hypothetical protein
MAAPTAVRSQITAAEVTPFHTAGADADRLAAQLTFDSKDKTAADRH